MSSFFAAWTGRDSSVPTELYERFAPYFVATLLLYLVVHQWGDKKVKLPEINPKAPFEITNRRRVAEFIKRSKSILINARAQYPKQAYRAYSDWGELVVIPPKYIDELRNDPRMDFLGPARDDGHAYIPGFDPFGADNNLPRLVNKHLTKALTKLTEPISKEATVVMRSILTDNPDWHSINLQVDIMRIVNRMSSRVFMGEELCKDEEWVRVSSEYTYDAFQLSDFLRKYPRSLRPIVHWFMPSCWRIRQKLNEARKVLQPHINNRHKLKAEARARRENIRFDDSIEWFEQEYNEGHDPATAQITLSLVAIHTTTDLLQQTMIDIALHPELLQPLREEVVRVLQSDGLAKTSLYKLSLMDSVIKESQRMKPILLGIFRREATTDIQLQDGFTIKKGTKIVADVTHMWNPSHYEHPEKFDGYRFLKMRQIPEQEKRAHLVSTSASHLGFGHGQHACPGRFFAANEIKIALCHLLLKYDWKLPEDFRPQISSYGMSILPDPRTRMMICRRKGEIDIDAMSL